MNRRHGLLILLAVGLITANLIRWWSTREEKHTIPQTKNGIDSFQIKDFQLQAVEVEGVQPPRRDLFQAHAPILKANRPTQLPPSKSPAQLAEEATKSELAQYRVVSVVFRNGHGHAYLVRGNESFLVTSGDKVSGRFTVISIATDFVVLRDTQTDISGRLPVMAY